MSDSGIYQITNTINGKRYIGSSVDFQKRWTLHARRLDKNIHHCHHLQAAWNKYGADCFEFAIIERCEKCELLTREQYYLDTLKPEYNISPTAGSRLGVKERQETRDKKSGKRGPRSDEDRMNRRISQFISDFPKNERVYTRGTIREFLTEMDNLHFEDGKFGEFLEKCKALSERFWGTTKKENA
jgi:group I intron endonuclease